MRKLSLSMLFIVVFMFNCTKEKFISEGNEEHSKIKHSSLRVSAFFTHPGTVLSKNQLTYAYAQAIAGVEPYKTTFNNFKTKYSNFLASTYTSHAHSQVGRNMYKSDYENDAMAVFVNGVMYNMTGDTIYADKALQLIDSWSSTLASIQYPDNDWQIALGYGFNFMIYGADLIYNYPSFTQLKKDNATKMFNIMYNCMVNYSKVFSKPIPFVRDGWPSWGSSHGKFLMALGVFSENTAMYNLGKSYLKKTASQGADVGTLETAFLSSGQPLEAARDQYYSQLSLASFLEAAQIDFNQGSPELFDWRSGVIGKAVEYTAKYNKMNSVTWTPMTPATSIWATKYPISTISANNRGDFRPIFYMASNYYRNYRGLKMPYSEQVMALSTIEGTTSTITDQVGWGSLFYNNKTQSKVIAPYMWSGVY